MTYIKKVAFTLVELIVVITILAILWTIAFLSFQWYSRDARDSVRLADLETIKKSLEMFQIQRWFLPEPSYYWTITYSWAEAWKQWTVWESVISNLSNISKIPSDPLTHTEYTYSRLNTKNKYELGCILEWYTASNLYIWSTYANWLKQWYAHIVWNYNQVAFKVSTWGLDYILSVPSIISSTIDDTDLLSIINNNNLVFNWFKNLPHSYNGTSYDVNWWFEFINNPIVFTWDVREIYSDEGKRLDFISDLKSKYSNNVSINSLEPYSKLIDAIVYTDEWRDFSKFLSNNILDLKDKMITSDLIYPINCLDNDLSLDNMGSWSLISDSCLFSSTWSADWYVLSWAWNWWWNSIRNIRHSTAWDESFLIYNVRLIAPAKFSFDYRINEYGWFAQFYINWVENWNFHDIPVVYNTFTTTLLPPGEYEFKWKTAIQNIDTYWVDFDLDNLNFSCIWWWDGCWINLDFEIWNTNPFDLFTFSWTVDYPWKITTDSNSWAQAFLSPSHLWSPNSNSEMTYNTILSVPTTLQFDYKVHRHWWWFRFFINDIEKISIWWVDILSYTQYSELLPPWNYKLTWEVYTSFQDWYLVDAYIDNIQFIE